MKENVYFVSGIDTNIGKSYATGYLAREWNKNGIRTITQKFIQTGNTELSEDIELHRKLMGTGLLPEDKEGLTMPEIFTYPCSPHLAAEIDKRAIDFNKIPNKTMIHSMTRIIIPVKSSIKVKQIGVYVPAIARRIIM